MTPTRIAVYVVTALLAVFGVVFVADALVESDEERLEQLTSRLTAGAGEERLDAVASWAGEESVAVVADRRRVWVDESEGEAVLRRAIDDAIPELAAGAPVVSSDATLTGRRARITLRLREERAEPVDVTVELAVDEQRFSLLEVRRMR